MTAFLFLAFAFVAGVTLVSVIMRRTSPGSASARNDSYGGAYDGYVASDGYWPGGAEIRGADASCDASVSDCSGGDGGGAGGGGGGE
jgi:hypothetical protein